jgi:hypothetical protein
MADGLYFHLSCERPSTVALASFSSPEVTFVELEALPSRSHSARETCASWFDRHTRTLFCATREGSVFRVDGENGHAVRWLDAQVPEPSSVPLFHLYGSDRSLWLAVAANDDERCVGLSSHVLQVDKSTAAVVRTIALPAPLLNFVVSRDGALLAGVNADDNILVVVNLITAKTVKIVENLGTAPAEVLFVD